MADKDLKRSSHRNKDGWWWYEEPKGIAVMVPQNDRAGNHLRTTEHVITWRSLRGALKRKDK